MLSSNQSVSLIGISGYAGAGKDTVARMIQFITWRSYVCRQLGLDPKDLKHWRDQPAEKLLAVHKIPNYWQVKSFADKLKQICSLLTGIELKHWYDPKAKETMRVGEDWTYWELDTGMENDGKLRLYSQEEVMILCEQRGEYYIPEKIRPTLRQFLERVGTEGIRNQVHPGTWSNSLFADYKRLGVITTDGSDLVSLPVMPLWLIPDTRFPNEAAMIKKKGGIVIRVNNARVPLTNFHASNVSLDEYPFDYRIDNDGDLDTLEETVRQMLDHYNLTNVFSPYTPKPIGLFA